MGNREFNDFIKQMSGLIPDMRRQIIQRQKNLFTLGNISLPQITILDFLYVQKRCIMSDISKMLAGTMSAATGLVDRMIKNGLLERHYNPDDRRTVEIALTLKGKKIARSFIAQHRKILKKMFEKISPADRRKYLEIIEKIHKNLLAEQ